MPEIDHRVSQGFQGIVQPTDALETNEQTPKLIFPREHSLDSVKPFFKNSRVEHRLASTLRRLSAAPIFGNIRNHPAIENGFPVRPTVVDPIQADHRLVQIEADLLGDTGHL